MPRGKPVSQELRQRIVEKLKNNMSERTISCQLDLSKSTVHYIIKKFKETGRMTAGKAKGKERILTAKEMRIFRRHIRATRNDNIADITVWARKLF